MSIELPSVVRDLIFEFTFISDKKFQELKDHLASLDDICGTDDCHCEDGHQMERLYDGVRALMRYSLLDQIRNDRPELVTEFYITVTYDRSSQEIEDGYDNFRDFEGHDLLFLEDTVVWKRLKTYMKPYLTKYGYLKRNWK